MKNHWKHGIWVLTLAAAAIGCESGGSQATGGGSGGAGGIAAMGSGGAAAGPGGAGGAGGRGVPLVDWVTDLAVNYAPDTHPPDTVDDKVIIDTEDPQAFDPLLQR